MHLSPHPSKHSQLSNDLHQLISNYFTTFTHLDMTCTVTLVVEWMVTESCSQKNGEATACKSEQATWKWDLRNAYAVVVVVIVACTSQRRVNITWKVECNKDTKVQIAKMCYTSRRHHVTSGDHGSSLWWLSKCTLKWQLYLDMRLFYGPWLKVYCVATFYLRRSVWGPVFLLLLVLSVSQLIQTSHWAHTSLL